MKAIARTRLTGIRTPKQRAGERAELAAERHLVGQGGTIVARNARYKEGERDLIASERGVGVFVEVRMRSATAFGGAAASVDRFRQKRLQRAAQHWLLQHYGERWPACRFDVVTVQGDGTIGWIRDAFAA